LTTIRRLPRFAETHFASLCAAAGVICHSPDEDEQGWDYFVQFPPKRVSMLPADMQPPGLDAFVQIKSTRTAPLDARLKLSNAFLAVQGSRPFFLVLVVDGSGGQSVYARHFWETEIIHTLKRVRLAERSGDTHFNRKHITIRMTADDRRDDLLAWMRETIEAVGPSYAAEKSRLAATVGHEDGFGTMDVSFEGTAQDLLDLQLGLIESLDVAHVRFVPQRFGIHSGTPQFELDNAKMIIEPSGKPARLRLQGGTPTREMFVDAVLYHASVPDGDAVRHRWRVDAGPLRLTGGDSTYSAKVTIGYEDRRHLGDLRVFLTLAAWRGIAPVGLQLFLGTDRIPLGTLTMSEGDHELTWSDLRHRVEALDGVAQAAQCNAPEVSIRDLLSAEPWLSRLAGLAHGASFRVDYQPEGNGMDIRAAIYWTACNVGDWCFLAVIERNMRDDVMIGQRRQLTFGAPAVLDAIVTKGDWRDQKTVIAAAYDAQVERLGTPDTLWELGDIEQFISEQIDAAA